MLAPTPGAVLLAPQTVTITAPGTTVVPNPHGGPQGVLPGPGDVYLGQATAISVDVAVTGFAGTGAPSIAVAVDRKGADGAYYQVFAGPAMTANGAQAVSAGLGLAGANSVFLGLRCRLRVVAAGTTVAASVTVSVAAT